MKQKDNTNTKQGHSANMLLYAVAPQPKLSTDSNALDGGKDSGGIAIGATSELKWINIQDELPPKHDLVLTIDSTGMLSLSRYVSNDFPSGTVLWAKINLPK